jgi:uncharacterized protein DUF6010
MLLAMIVTGAVLGIIWIVVVRTTRRDTSLSLYALGLAIAAVIYVAFALVGPANGTWLAVETLGVARYGAAAWVGRGSPVVLGIGWAAHAAWDVLLHLGGAGALYTPGWYPWACVGFDLVVAVELVRSRR